MARHSADWTSAKAQYANDVWYCHTSPVRTIIGHALDQAALNFEFLFKILQLINRKLLPLLVIMFVHELAGMIDRQAFGALPCPDPSIRIFGSVHGESELSTRAQLSACTQVRRSSYIFVSYSLLCVSLRSLIKLYNKKVCIFMVNVAVSERFSRHARHVSCQSSLLLLGTSTVKFICLCSC